MINSAHHAAAPNGTQRPARHLRWARTAAASAAVQSITSAKLQQAAPMAVLMMPTPAPFQRLQAIRARTAKMANAMNRDTVQWAPTAPTAVPVAHLPVHSGIGTLQTAHRVGANRGVTQALLLTLAAKTWG